MTEETGQKALRILIYLYILFFSPTWQKVSSPMLFVTCNPAFPYPIDLQPSQCALFNHLLQEYKKEKVIKKTS